jgi:isocitrate dehydrogenase
MKKAIHPSISGDVISFRDGQMTVPDQPIIPFIRGDGSGPDIWRTAQKVLDAAVEKAYQGKRRIAWYEVTAGETAFDQSNTWLPEETLQAFQTYRVGIKGPLTTPVGEGIRSLNVAIRKALDLYVCLRPVRWFRGVPSPMSHPERVNIVVFRENTEDIYTGIEFQEGTAMNRRFLDGLANDFPDLYTQIRFKDQVGISIKPISRQGSQRLVRSAMRWALENNRQSVTLVHKGNIMKFTEGAFRNWGYDLVETDFSDSAYSHRKWEDARLSAGLKAAEEDKALALASGKVMVNDIITDAAFEAVITRPQDFDILATTNLNGDYLSDALAALVGGIGIAPGANINYETGHAVFEATHGTAPTLAGKDVANPCSVILSGEMMLRHLGWGEAASLVISSVENVISSGKLTADLAQHSGSTLKMRTSEFGAELLKSIKGMEDE